VHLAEGGGRVAFDLPQLPVRGAEAASTNIIADALGLTAEDIGFGDFRPGQWSAGNPLAFVPLRNLNTVRRSRADLARWDAAFAGNTGAFVFCAETVEAGSSFHARMFAPSFGIAEDPATGSAAAALAGILAEQAGLPDGEHEFVIEQGYEMGRPSLMTLALTLRGRNLVAASIAGDAVIVSEGAIEA
jgi:trans-2,3-dihydro-3-hydroxyanthranilate isomerase